MRFILFLLLTVSSLAFGQRTQTINADCLRIQDGTCIAKDELGYLDNATSEIQAQINNKASLTDLSTGLTGKVGTTGDETVSGAKTFDGKFIASSTANGFKPCPSMTETQRNAVASPVSGDCIYNSSSASLNIYNGTIWKTAGGGLSNWETSFSYAVNDIVIESNKIYQCLIAHTSGTFATDLVATKWLRVSTDVSGATGVLPLSSGGTNKNATASNGAIAYSDTDSLELLAPGTSGQVLQTNGAAAPTFVNKSISAKAENGSSVTLEEIQVPNNQLTSTATNKHLLNDCGSSNNLLLNCGFEHSTPATGWTLTAGSSAVDTTTPKQGKQALKLTLSSQALDFYQTSTLNAAAFADGVSGSIFLAIKTTVDNVYLCRTDSAGAVVASTDGTKITNCVKVSNSGKWGDYVMPIILGATSNGMRLVSLTPSTAAAVAVTGDVYVDSGILETGLKATSQGVCTDVSCQAEFSAKVSITGVVSDENYDFISTTTATPSSAQYTLVFTSGVFSVAPNCTAIVATAGQNGSMVRVQSVSTSQIQITASYAGGTGANPSTLDQAFNLTCQRSGTDFTNAKALASGRFYTVPSDSFSTDTNTLAHKTTAIVAADPIGTYNTYSYAINTNTKTICGTAPSILPNAADGFKIFTRAYNAASTCGNPARVEIKIGAAGTKFPTIKTDIYKSAAKVTSGGLDRNIAGAFTGAYGAYINNYDELSGVLVIDTGINDTAVTSHQILFTDGTAQTSGYLVINAQKAKDSIIGSFAEVNTSPGISKPKTCHYAFGGSGATLTALAECVTGTCIEVYDSCGTGTPPAFASTGVYTDITFASGTFSNSSHVDCNCTAFSTTTASNRECFLRFITSDNTWASNSSGGFVSNIVSYDRTPSVQNSYIHLTCKGQAP